MPATSIEIRLRAALTKALSSRDSVEVSALRSTMSAIANAEAVPPAAGSRAIGSEHVAGAVAGLGAAEAARRELTEADVTAIVASEIDDRRSAADEYERFGRTDRATRLRQEADVLARIAAGS